MRYKAQLQKQKMQTCGQGPKEREEWRDQEQGHKNQFR